MFHYHGKPVSAQDAADIIRHRTSYRKFTLAVQRARDQQVSGLFRQLWAMIRGRA